MCDKWILWIVIVILVVIIILLLIFYKPSCKTKEAPNEVSLSTVPGVSGQNITIKNTNLLSGCNATYFPEADQLHGLWDGLNNIFLMKDKQTGQYILPLQTYPIYYDSNKKTGIFSSKIYCNDISFGDSTYYTIDNAHNYKYLLATLVQACYGALSNPNPLDFGQSYDDPSNPLRYDFYVDPTKGTCNESDGCYVLITLRATGVIQYFALTGYGIGTENPTGGVAVPLVFKPPKKQIVPGI